VELVPLLLLLLRGAESLATTQAVQIRLFAARLFLFQPVIGAIVDARPAARLVSRCWRGREAA
jgi:hypothetical protein